MSIYRIEKTNKFTTVDNSFILDSRLSFKAKGLLLYMLSRPDDWHFYESEFVDYASDGLYAVRSGLKELISCGYIKRERLRDELNQFCGFSYQVFEQSLQPKN